MRTILRYVDGRAIWSENTPGANPGSSKIGGDLVVGVSASAEVARQREAKRERRARQASEKAA